VNKTELKKLRSKARRACLNALRKLAKDNGLRTQRVAAEALGKMTNAGFAIGDHVGLGMNVLAGTVIMGRNGYISCFPHGENHHSMLREAGGPGWGTPKDWGEFIQKPVLAYVDFAKGKALFADNFDPTSEKKVNSMMQLLEISKESCEWGRKDI
jgi:hypothetical protein